MVKYPLLFNDELFPAKVEWNKLGDSREIQCYRKMINFQHDLVYCKLPDGGLLDIEWDLSKGGRFVARIVYDRNWQKPRQIIKTKSFERLRAFVKNVIHEQRR